MPKRSLMLAGGGVKIAFQAGVLQVWLDEAGIEFDHADAVSAACFNLAMWVQGLSGTQIADNWRNVDPTMEVDLNWPELPRLLYAASLFDLDAFRHKIFPAWGLDWEKIRSSKREATFNVYNFSKHELRSVISSEMTEDFLVATASLPVWFPPITIVEDTYIDAVFNTGSNLEEAIRRGADELWVIWTTSQRGVWYDGFVGAFFGIFEATTNGGYKRMLARIGLNNHAVARGEASEFGRHITVRELKAEVPLHYLFNFSKDRAVEAVNRGVEAARVWCDAQQIERTPGPVYTHTASEMSPTRLHFSEVFKGFIGLGATEYQSGVDQGRGSNTSLEVNLSVQVDDIDRFITMPEHEAVLYGTVSCERFGGRQPITRGTLNLLVDDGDPTRKKVTYRISFTDARGTPLMLIGEKDLQAKPSEHSALNDNTSVLTRICRSEASIEVIAMGIIHIGTFDQLKQLASFRVEAPTLARRLESITRFGAFYFGHMWDVYARHVLPVAPF